MARKGEETDVSVVLFNLGGPLNQSHIRPFLYNLFSDPHIIQLPGIIRLPIAWGLSRLRAAKVRQNYQKLGGGSPLLENTQRQAAALEAALRDAHLRATCHVCMRYWTPRARDVIKAIDPAHPVVLLPLYPQYSTTTTQSSLDEWFDFMPRTDRVRVVESYPQALGLVKHYRDLLTPWGAKPGVRVLFSAHGLPQDIVDRGDPYPQQIAESVGAIVAGLDLDYQICYQSRVGPKKWLQPYLEDALTAAARDAKIVVVVPISFVSEHIETLVDLDQTYANHARGLGLTYYRLPTPGEAPDFIHSLRDLVMMALEGE